MDRNHLDHIANTLKPLADIAEAYLCNELNPTEGMRRQHMHDTPADKVVICKTRSGRPLLTLQQCFNARGVLASLSVL